MPLVATLNKRLTNDTGGVVDDGSIRVMGFLITAIGSTDRFEFTDKDGNVIFTAGVITNGTTVISFPWIADNGLRLTGGSVASLVTVFYNQPGA